MRPDPEAAFRQLKFRDPERARGLTTALERWTARVGREPVAIMHVCGSHEQAIARFGLRAVLPDALDVIMGPGCPVCVTDVPEIDEAVALALQGIRVASYGDMLRVPGSSGSLADAQGAGGKVHVVYSVTQAVALAHSLGDEELVFFASGFETTAVATAAVALSEPPPNFSILSAHKYVPPAMEIVAGMAESRIEGFLAAGHAAIITGSGIFESFAERYRLPVVVAGFEPLDILAGLVKLVQLIAGGEARAVNMYPRCVTREGNLPAQEQLWKVFNREGGQWRGITFIPDGNLRLRDDFAHLDARRRFDIDLGALWDKAPIDVADECLCGAIMSGTASPTDCSLFGERCVPDDPVGACMVSSEGTCKIWHEYGGHPKLRVAS